jgi:hypothetical protein
MQHMEAAHVGIEEEEAARGGRHACRPAVQQQRQQGSAQQLQLATRHKAWRACAWRTMQAQALTSRPPATKSVNPQLTRGCG